MKIYIVTQYCENYAAHDWDGEGEVPQGWKYKHGSFYVLQGVSVNEAADRDTLDALVNELSELIVYSNDYSEEYIINWALLDDGEELPVEPWESPVMITRRDGIFEAKDAIINDEYGYLAAHVDRVVYTYTMVKGGQREDTQREVVYRRAAA